MTLTDWTAWARELARAYDDIAMIVRFDTPTAGDHVCLVMKDGAQAAWFAAGKGIEGAAWTSVPGRATMPTITADERVRHAGLRVYANYCDVRALMFQVDSDGERIAGDELVDAPYRMLYPDGADRPPLEEFFLLWGEPE